VLGTSTQTADSTRTSATATVATRPQQQPLLHALLLIWLPTNEVASPLTCQLTAQGPHDTFLRAYLLGLVKE